MVNRFVTTDGPGLESIEDGDGNGGPSSPDVARFKDVMGRFATGVTVVTAFDEGAPLGFTCQSFISLSLDPPFVALAPAKSSTSWPLIADAGAFCVNVLGAQQAEIGRTFAHSGGDKFVGVDWRHGKSGAPVLDGVIAWIDCKLELVHDAGDHELVVGRVVDLGANDGAPLIFYRKTYTSIAALEK
jgi:flavin reductase (DIM6/NTAB) family NADH-FMN oxidoreductase RutF